MTSNRSDRNGFTGRFYSGTNRILKNADPITATAMIVALATVIAMATSVATHLSTPFVAAYVFGIDSTDFPLSVILINAGIAAVVTSFPIVTYCVGLVSRLRETKYDLKGALASAEAANLAKSSFLANMSHEIRTPLNGVLGMADVLSQEDLPPYQADCVMTIRESGTTLMAILNDVLDLSKIEAGKLEIAAVDSSLHHVFYSTHKLFLPRANEKNITLTLQIGESVPERLRFDTVRVRQCLSNLVSNAVKFTETGGVTISVSCVTAMNGLRLVNVTVADTGIGMSEEVMSRLFSDFAQADASTSRKFGGTGLGLAISRNLANLMGGDVTLSSKPGLGTLFTFSFKAAPAQQAGSGMRDDVWSGRPGRTTLLDGLRVLLVDDNAVNRKVTRMLLKPTKMKIVDAENGMQALDLLADQPFDLVLLDVHMPVMDGPTAIGHIRASQESWNSVPVIALTADAMSGHRERLFELGMTGYVTKPVDQRTLIAEIVRVCSEAATKAGQALSLAAQ